MLHVSCCTFVLLLIVDMSGVTPANPRKKGQFINFSRGQTGTKVRCESRLFSQEKRQNSKKWAKFMNFSFWPFLWFALPGRLLNMDIDCRANFGTKHRFGALQTSEWAFLEGPFSTLVGCPKIAVFRPYWAVSPNAVMGHSPS